MAPRLFHLEKLLQEAVELLVKPLEETVGDYKGIIIYEQELTYRFALIIDKYE